MIPGLYVCVQLAPDWPAHQACGAKPEVERYRKKNTLAVVADAGGVREQALRSIPAGPAPGVRRCDRP